jgi:hypothetical protein
MASAILSRIGAELVFRMEPLIQGVNTVHGAVRWGGGGAGNSRLPVDMLVAQIDVVLWVVQPTPRNAEKT